MQNNENKASCTGNQHLNSERFCFLQKQSRKLHIAQLVDKEKIQFKCMLPGNLDLMGQMAILVHMPTFPSKGLIIVFPN